MKKRFILINFLLFVIFFACSTSENERLIYLAEKCIEKYPDSASVFLSKIRNIMNESDNQIAKYALLKVQAAHKTHQTIKNDSLIDFAIEYYTNKDIKRYAAKSFLYKGLIYRERGEIERAVESFANSEIWFRNVEDNQYKALLHNFYGLLMAEQTNYQMALEHYKKSYAYYLKGDSIHYMLTACTCVARMYRLLDFPDSARMYYEQGKILGDKCKNSNRYNRFLLNYATFLVNNKEYEKAESLLMECGNNMTDENFLHVVHSGFATLYYTTQKYEKALKYAEKLLTSPDSLIVRGGYLQLYRIHRKLGNIQESDSCYKWYNIYHRDIRMRLNTVGTAMIPHKVNNRVLTKEINKVQNRLWMLTTVTIAIFVVGLVLYRLYYKKQTKLNQELKKEKLQKEKIEESAKETNLQKELKIGNLKSQLTHKQTQIEKLKKKEQENKQKIEKQKKDISELENHNEAINTSLIQRDKQFSQVQNEMENMQKALNFENSKNQKFLHYIQHTDNPEIIALLLYLRYNKKCKVPVSEYECLLKELVEKEYPEMRQTIDKVVSSQTKRIICYLLVLGFDKKDILERGLPLVSSDTIRRYRKECLQIVKGVDR